MRRMSSDWSTSLASGLTKANRSEPCWDRHLRARRSRTSTSTSKASLGCPKDDFVNHFAGDVDPSKARVMHAVQQPLHASAWDEVIGTPAWKSLPSWFLVAQGDQAIPPDAQRNHGEPGPAVVVSGKPAA
jgi:hypothetical protein